MSGDVDTTPLATSAEITTPPRTPRSSHVIQTRLSSAQLKRFNGVLLWVIAANMAIDLLT